MSLPPTSMPELLEPACASVTVLPRTFQFELLAVLIATVLDAVAVFVIVLFEIPPDVPLKPAAIVIPGDGP